MDSLENQKIKLVNEIEVENNDLSLSEFFREKRKSLQDRLGEGLRSYYPMEKIAEGLNISKEMLQHKLYKKKPLTRDWLIAICAAYGLNDKETDDALIICQMPRLDALIAREDFLIDYLRDINGYPKSIKEVNCALRDHGYSELDTNRHKEKNKANDSLPQKKGLSYTVARKVVRTYLDEGDQYNSLETAFDFRYRCVAAAFLEKDGNIKYILEAFSDGHLSVTDKDLPFPQFFKTVNETGEFRDYFSKLVDLVKQEQHKIEAQLNDSKNYQGRLSANLKNDAIHVFYEEFNYALPERNEYYLMEYIDGQLKLSVSKQSMFMNEYLSVDEYKKYYGTQFPNISEKYRSHEEIIEKINDTSPSSYHREILSKRRSAFVKLSKIVYDALDKIRNRTLFIRNFEMIWENPGDVCKFYGLEKEFDCTHDGEYGEIVLGKEEAKLTEENGHSIIISFQELKRAFELGFLNSEQICRVKMLKGSIEDVL